MAEQDTPLFRTEALQARRPQMYGEIVLMPGASSRWVAVISVLLIAALMALVTQGSYTRRSTVVGQLQPSQGLIRITSAQPGVVVERMAGEGREVKRGDPLFVLSGDRQGPDAVDYQRDIGSQILARRESLESEAQRLGVMANQEAEQLRRRAASMRQEAQQVKLQAGQLMQMQRSAEDMVARYQSLLASGAVSRGELEDKQTELANLRGRALALDRELIVLQREEVAAARELDAVRARVSAQRSELQRGAMSARQEFTELEAKRRIVVAAPADGRLTLVQGEIGQTVEPLKPLAQLMPAGTELTARLYVPSRAAGFVQPGTQVMLRYDAFPYQKYGQHQGKVVAISAAAVPAEELQGVALPPQTEALFAISVALPAQTMGSAGAALQAGMRVEADLLHESRRLYEWIIEPLAAIRARAAAPGPTP
jgi:membrane fusion protein